MPTLRLLCVDARPYGRDRAAVAELIGSAGADLAAVHGAPQLLRWRSLCAALGRRSGLVVLTGGRTAAANLLLSSLAVDVAAVRDLRLAGGSALRRPGAALAAVRFGGAGLVLASASLIGNAAERVAQTHHVQDAIGALAVDGRPAIVCAQGVDRPGTAAWQSLARGRRGVAGRIFVDERIDVGAVRELPSAVADEPPVIVELTVPA